MLDMGTAELMHFLGQNNFKQFKGSVDDNWECYQRKQLVDGNEYVLFPRTGVVKKAGDWSKAGNIGSDLNEVIPEFGRDHKPVQFDFVNRYSALNLLNDLERSGFKRRREFKIEEKNDSVEGGTVICECIELHHMSYFAVYCERKRKKPLYQVLIAKREDLSISEQIVELEKEASPIRIDIAQMVQARPSTGGPMVLIVIGAIVTLFGISALPAIVLGMILLAIGLISRSGRLSRYEEERKKSQQLADRLKELESRVIELRAKQKA